MCGRAILVAATLAGAVLAGQDVAPSPVLPAAAVERLGVSLASAAGIARHVWRDRAPLQDDRIVAAYIEIPLGERRKWELDMRTNQRRVDRVIPEEVGGYPINYGFVPQTVSYDGDPFDALVLGPALPGGEMTRGAIVGLMHMTDEKGPDAKVVLSPLDERSRPRFGLTDTDRGRLTDFFNRYKQHQPGAHSKVTGWGTAADGHAYVSVMHAFFRQCRKAGGDPCRVAPN